MEAEISFVVFSSPMPVGLVCCCWHCPSCIIILVITTICPAHKERARTRILSC